MVGNELNVLYASPSGDATSYYAVTGTGTESSVAYPIYVTRRINGSWSSDGINPPASLGPEVSRLGYTENMMGSYTVAGKPIFTEPWPYGLYLREFGGKLTRIANASIFYKESLAIISESEDGNTVLFESRDSLTPSEGSLEGFPNLYTWTKSTGELQLVDLLPQSEGGTPPAEGAYGGPWGWFAEFLGGGENAAQYYTKTALNREGTRAFFTDANTESHQIYLRANPASGTATTTLISASQKTNGSGPNGKDPNGLKPADFLEATPNGKYVFFKSHSALTNDANTGPADEGQDLYRYDVTEGKLLDITPHAGAAGAEVRGLAGISEDGTYAYFVANANLSAGATAGKENIYMWHEGDPLQFVATVEPGRPGEEIWAGTRYAFNFLGQKAARVSADGQTIAFNAGGPKPAGEILGAAAQVYRWEVGGSGLHCLSCNPNGTTEDAASFQQTPQIFIQPLLLQSVATRNLSTNGRRAFFSTAEALVPADVNGVEDVYEWEAPEEGSCTSEEVNGGCVFLMSTGTSPDRSYFDDASANGNDAFFFTDQSLVKQDKDEELYDVYDARVEGGIAAQNAVPVVPCEGEACLGAGTSAPNAQARGTATFNGPGNPVQCKKGFVKKNGKCVKKQKKKKQKKKKQNGKKQSQKTTANRAPTAGGDR